MPCVQVLVVMGVTGAEKSTFIQHATGKVVKIGHGQEACAAEVKMYQIPDTSVYLMDTPDFDDTYLSDADILQNIATALVDAFNDQVEIQGALYIHPVTEAKMRGLDRKNLLMFQNVLGMKGMNHCRLVITKWKKEFWQPVLTAGAQTVRFGDSMESAIDIIGPLLQGPALKPLLVKEVVEKHKKIPETHAGVIVNNDLEKAKIHLAEIADLRAREQKAKGEMREPMREEREEHEAALARVAGEKDVLASQVSARSSGRFGRWIARGCAWVGGGLMTVASAGALAPAAALLIAGIEPGAQAHKRMD